MDADNKCVARRIWVATSGLMYRGDESKQHKSLQAGEEVTDIVQSDLADFLKRVLVEQKLVEA